MYDERHGPVDFKRVALGDSFTHRALAIDVCTLLQRLLYAPDDILDEDEIEERLRVAEWNVKQIRGHFKGSRWLKRVLQRSG